jgi:hypothetical protein
MRVVADFDFDLDVAKARFSFKPGFLKVNVHLGSESAISCFLRTA